MVDAFALGLPTSVRRFGISFAPYFSHRAELENIRIQCQLPEFSVTFLKGVPFENYDPSCSRLCTFA